MKRATSTRLLSLLSGLKLSDFNTTSIACVVLFQRSAVLEDEIEEMKRKQREVGEKARNDKRKLDLELINFKDTGV